MRINLIITLFSLCTYLGAQDRYSEQDGHKFRFREFGKGKATVIFECGMSDSLEAWGSIPDSVSQYARVFMYDRADIGKSDTSVRERTIPNMVTELKNILDKESMQPPYILVGHSLGGYITRYFCSRYPELVIGLVLLDPSPEAYWGKMSTRELRDYIKGGTEWYSTRFTPKYRKEWYAFIPNMVYMHNLNISKELKIILVTASEPKWYKYQKEQVAGFKNAKQIELKGSHYIHRDHPDKIINYIKELIPGKPN